MVNVLKCLDANLMGSTRYHVQSYLVHLKCTVGFLDICVAHTRKNAAAPPSVECASLHPHGSLHESTL